MNISIKPSKINGTVNAPSSKSEMQRVVAAALLAEGVTTITNPSYCEDAKAALNIIQNLGAKITINKDSTEVYGGLQPKQNILNCGEAGLSLRMFSPIAALCEEEIILQGEGSLKTRPVYMLEEPLKMLGAECVTNNGFPPVKIKGPLKGGSITIDGSVSSQFLTGLLMALPKAPQNSQIKVKSLKSKPYIDMTISVLEKFEIKIDNSEYKVFDIPGNQTFKPCNYSIEGDWSGASFLLVAGAVAGKVKVNNLKMDSIQADKRIIKALELAGAQIEMNDNSICVTKNNLECIEFDATDCPDLFPPLVALTANCKGTSVITGVERLKHKESDRATVLKNEFANIGINVEIKGNNMLVHGGKISGGRIFSHNDHRIAMAGAVAALSADKEIIIEEAECIAKSYPAFFDDLETLSS